MSLFQRGIRPPAIWSDEAVERYLAAIRKEITLDPMFRRRLRGSVVNRFVAEREGTLRAGRRAGARRMGALGRSVLYASFALGVSVTGTMAASQGSIPGEVLYPLKRQIETLRLEALPAHVHDDLAAHALGERIQELGRLAEQGDWARVAAHASAMAEDSAALLQLMELDSASANRHLVVLNGLIDRLPDQAQLAIADVVHDVGSAANSGADGLGEADGGSANGQGGGFPNGQNGSSSNGQGSASGQNGQAAGASPGEPGAKGPKSTTTAEPTPRPTSRAEPRTTLKPDATPKPKPTPRSSKKGKPSPASTQAPSEDSSD